MKCFICQKAILSSDIYINSKGEERPNVPMNIPGIPGMVHKKCKINFQGQIIKEEFLIDENLEKQKFL